MYSYAYLQNIPEPMSTSQFVFEVRVICTFPSVSFSQADRRQTFEQESESRERKNCFYKGGVKWKAGPQARSPKGYQCQHGRAIPANSFGFLLRLCVKQVLGPSLHPCFRMTHVPGLSPWVGCVCVCVCIINSKRSSTLPHCVPRYSCVVVSHQP